MTGGVIDQFFVALGFQPDSSGLKTFQRQAEEAKSTMLSIGTAIAGFAARFAVKEIAKIGDEFEQNTIAIAGFFDALGVSTGGFDNAMKAAASTMDQIVKDAARLPGEAEEYIEIFRAGLPVLREAKPHADVHEITDFTNQLAAIAHTLKLPYEVTSREMQELFIQGEGHATKINVLFKRFLPFLRQVDGQAKLTTKSFNAMTAEQRVDLFRQSFEKLQPMLERSASSFDAMWGALVSGVRQVTRYATSGLFEKIKKSIDGFNASLFNADGTMTETGQNIVDIGRRVSRMVGNVVDFGTALVKWMGKSEFAAKGLKNGLALLGLTLGGLAFEKVAGSIGRLVTGISGLKRLLTGGLFMAIFLVAEDLYVFKKGGDSVTGMLVNKLGPAGEYLSKTVLGGLILALGAVRFAFVRTAIRAVASWATILGPLTLVLVGVGALAGAIYYAYTHWDQFGAGAKTAITAVTTALAVLGGALVAFQASAVAASLRIAVGFLMMNLPLLLVVATLAAVAVAAYELGNHWDDVVTGMTEAWDAFVDGLKETANTITSVWGLFGDGPFETKSKQTHREYEDTVAEARYRRAHKGENAATGMSEMPTRPKAAPEASWDPSVFKNPRARREDLNKYQSAVDEDTTTPDERESFTADERARYDANRRRFSQAFAERVRLGMASADQNPYGGAGGSPGAAVAGMSSLNPVAMTGVQAGVGAPGVTNNNVTTNVTNGPVTVNITGSPDHQATARAVRRELERQQQSTVRQANNRGAAL